jgi:cytoskeletal protein CcmA (bactofilin family)
MHTPAPRPNEATLTLIAPDTHIRGEVTFQNPAQILGRIEGKVTSTSELLIGSSAECRATVQAATLIVEGTVEGDVIATDRLELNTSARITGDLVASRLVVAEGATFSGHCIVGPEAARKAAGQNPGAAGNGVPQQSLVEGAPSKPRLVARPQVHTSSDLDATLAGLESKLAGFTKAKAAAGE